MTSIIPNRNLPTPLYAQIKEILLERIHSGEWQPGMCIPTEAELCQSFRVSLITVRNALRELVNEGYLERISGRGTFVKPPRINQMLRQLTSFTEDMHRRGQTPDGNVLEVLTTPASVAAAGQFDLPEAEELISFKRLRLADGEPMAVETAQLPARYFPGLADEKLDGQSLYQIMREKYDVIPTRAVQQITAALCPPAWAELLNISKKSAVLHIYRTTFDQFNRVIELVESYYRGDKYVFQTELLLED